jgi:hypothetical protein
MIDDAHIRRLILTAIPDIEPHKLEVQEMDYGAAVGWWLTNEVGYKDHGRVIALRRSEADIAKEIAGDIATKRCGTVIEDAVVIGPFLEEAATSEDGKTWTPIEISPYEGKGGRHPANCTCSKHRA